MKILFISALEVKEKGAQSIRMTLEGYANAGHEVFLLTQSKKNAADYFYENDFEHNKINIIRMNLVFSKLATSSVFFNGLRNIIIFILAASYMGIRLNKKEKFNLIYGYEVQGVISAKLVSIWGRKKMISRFQGTVLYPLLNKKTRNKKRWLWYWYHRLAMRLPSDMYIMTNDGTLGDKVLEYFKVPKEKVRFWMNGVNKDILQPKYKDYLRKKYGIAKDTKILITVHRLTYWKRTDRAINALAVLLNKKLNVCLVVVGDGERRSDLEKMAKRLGVNNSIYFAGGVPNDEVGKYLNGADIYLGTYDLSNAGNPLFEAMLSGLAVISLDNGSTTDFLGRGKAGILIEDEKDFALNIEKLIKDEKELNKWKELAKNYSHQKFWTWDERISQEIKEVEELASS